MSLIDPAEYKGFLKQYIKDLYEMDAPMIAGAIERGLQKLEMQPTVDAVEVVRCKDCKSHHWEQEPCHGKTVHICSKLNAEVTRDFYCAAGERRST